MDIGFSYESITFKITMQDRTETFDDMLIQIDDGLYLTFPGFTAGFIDPGVASFTFPCSSDTFGTSARTGKLTLEAHNKTELGYYIYSPLVYAPSDYFLGKRMFGMMGRQDVFPIDFPRLPIIECYFLLPDLEVPISSFQSLQGTNLSYPGRLL